MKLPFEDELLELERKQYQCLELLDKKLERQMEKIQNLIVGMTWINLALLVTIIIIIT